ncbi:FKBP-type peptidyl-prolyl cis-trans isomerase [candidate division KSB1 bacterium]|nr:FKBP-type peptidyl-prolyl cis-trans isomerase [candidate division KSB1 bacterium]
MKTVLAIALAAAVILTGCNEKKTATTTETTAPAATEKKMDAANTPLPGVPVSGQPVTTPSGLKYYDMTPGTGASPATGQTCVMHYTGWTTDGKEFDSSVKRGQPFEFPIGQGRVIKGWDEGVASMKIGGKRKLVIPSELGYGARGAGGAIPPNATLVFDVELLGLK